MSAGQEVRESSAPAYAAEPGYAGNRARSLLGAAQESRRRAGWLSPWLAVGVLFVVGATRISGFDTPGSLGSLLTLAAFLGVAAAGQTTVILLGGIDLSVASTIGMGEVVTSVLYGRHVSYFEIALLLVGFAFVIGLINGGVSSVARVHPLVVTLGSAFVIQGAVLIWTQGGMGAGAAPPFLIRLTIANTKLGPIFAAPVIAVWLCWAIIGWILERRAVAGRHIYALGSAERAAMLALARRKTTWIVAFFFSALSGELAGALLTGFSGGANFGVGDPYLFTTITAVVVGGTALVGGSGGAWRTVAGALIVTELTTILIGFGFDPNLQDALLGAFILVVALVTGRESHLRNRV